jgi:hypothetical protein
VEVPHDFVQPVDVVRVASLLEGGVDQAADDALVGSHGKLSEPVYDSLR